MMLMVEMVSCGEILGIARDDYHCICDDNDNDYRWHLTMKEFDIINLFFLFFFFKYLYYKCSYHLLQRIYNVKQNFIYKLILYNLHIKCMIRFIRIIFYVLPNPIQYFKQAQKVLLNLSSSA